ncbi:AIR synthase related protein [Nakamurella sp. UYEF19]|uniref:AIR synthase related protein n=1 Tax=Nakamurella sp. UYEF19 TaxID=1756392 RepID=UPI0033968A71
MIDLLPVWPTGRVRDLSLITLPDGSRLVIACDSVGGIGPHPGDSVAATAHTTGHFAARVPLIELVAAGATPRLIVNTLCFAGGTEADQMVAAVNELAAEVGLGPEAVTGSTEENAATSTTGIGVTVIGSAGPDGLRVGRSRAGDLVVCLGLPRSAPAHELHPTDPEMPSIAEVVAALAIPGVHEALPVGSRGVRHEIAQLAATAGLRHQWTDRIAGRGQRQGDRHQRQDAGFDVSASGGPASCVLVSLDPAALPALRSIRADLPVVVVGELSDFPAPSG